MTRRQSGKQRGAQQPTPAPPPPLSSQGRDKHENEALIAHGLPIDVWLHVDDLSSAHVYLRPPPSHPPTLPTIDAIPQCVLDDACQLTKANSIAGSKAASVAICYTPWANLLKRQSHDVGTIGFKDEKVVRHVLHVKRDAEAVKRIEKTRREIAKPDFAGEKAAWEAEQAAQRRTDAAARAVADKAARAAAEKEKEARSYDTLLGASAAMATPADLAGRYASAADYEDDFM